MLTLRLLGSPECLLEGRPLGHAGRDRGLLLLAYLAATAGQAHAREALAGHFWPGMAGGRALHNLRQLLLRLRRLLPDPGRAPAWFLTHTHGVAFNREADYWLDVEQLLLPLAGGRPEELAQRAALYRGPFLAGCDAGLGEELADWLNERRAACHHAALKLEEALCAEYAHAGRPDLALPHAQRCIDLEPWQEGGWRLLMHLLTRSGQANAALQQYEQLRDGLQRELGAAPEAATTELAERIRRGDIVSAEEAARVPPKSVRAERRPVTVLECALACRSGCADDCQDPESLASHLDAPLAQARAIAEAHGGHAGSVRPDGFAALFGWPQGNEHASRDAATAALEILRTLAAEHPGMAAAIGIDSGLMLDGPDPQGSWAVTERALRLRFAAAAGTALIGEATHAALRGGFDLEALCAEKGRPASWQLKAREPAGAGMAHDEAWPFIGRAAERKALAQGWRKARKGQVQALLLTGEAGIGKSRLVREFIIHAAKPAEAFWLECEPRGQESPLLPVIHHLRQRFSLDGAADGEILQARLGERAQQLMPLLTAQSPALAGQKPALLRALGEVLIAPDRPALIVIEDAHWADASTLEWLDTLMHPPHEDGLMIVMTARQAPALPPALARRLRPIALDPLDPETSHALARHVAGAACPPAVVELAQGVPLFLVELARLQASQPAGRMQRTLPDSLRALLQAHLQQAEEHRMLLQVGALLGQEFSLGDWRHLAIAAGMPAARPAAACEALFAAGLLEPAGEPNHVRFTHALLQQAALDALPRERRAELHRHHAARLQERGGPADNIAWHLAQGGLAAQAADAWLRAARQACRIEAYRETAQLAGRALASRPARKTELGALLLAAYAHMALGGYFDDAAQALYARARTLVGQGGADAWESLATLRGHWLGASSRASHREARAIAEEMIVIADGARADYFRGMARYLAGNSALWQGDFAAARALLEEAVELLTRPAHARGALDAHDQDFEVTATGYLGWACWFCGEPQRALDLGRRALATARSRGHLMTRLHAATTLSCICMHGNRFDEVLEIAGEIIECSQSAELAMWAAIGTLNRYWALTNLGRAADAATARQVVEHLCAIYPGGEAGFQTMMADAALQRRAPGEARSALAALARSLAQTEAGLYAVPQLLIEGELARLEGRPRRASRKFHEAARAALAQGSPALLEEAQERLARLGQKTARAPAKVSRRGTAPGRRPAGKRLSEKNQ